MCVNHEPYKLIILNYSSSKINGSEEGKRLASALRKIEEQAASVLSNDPMMKMTDFSNLKQAMTVYPRTRIIAIMEEADILRR